MGQFTTRPEEPTEWAGLPSEPIQSRPAAESPLAPVSSADSLALLGTTIESVSIPLASPSAAELTAAADHDGEPPAPDGQ
jgi:hypothetical protein